ncbi:regulatory protein, tetR family [Saccharopolyspora antimicrobica]|uniref:Regulatory protein, tetR family n=1 Tax=Saccharopolyspora antimicrobica TaxID=455193 RepID=A0A1I5M434_9PSEU|nr:TetR/AcrR family transcriptional regulator C-terminal domain-containing protein [Saccharopolyspora antimicrobica]RKT83150.1 TetR family transcriptional regulator [Saccharopolyspora antimicrobica]SFP04275.1 regulatory protein, tetR family [Saccharopolyspora antimicrobica]
MTTPDAPRRRGRPPKLTREAVLAAALEVLDESGHDGLSMRAVAERLGVGKMSLYHHVADRAELERLLIERLLAELDVPDAALPWRERISALAHSVRSLVIRHPNATPLVALREYSDPASLRLPEAVMLALRDAGLSGVALVGGSRLVFSYAIGFAQIDLIAREDGSDAVSPMASLSAAEFPNIVAGARLTRGLSFDDQFELGLQPLLAGLAAMATA